ncbi:MAG: VF530 family protein [Pseudomonadota bacterium]
MKQDNSPPSLHGVTLEAILTELVAVYGWVEMAKRVNIRCFTHDPSVKSSLKFLRKTPWAREKVEEMYLQSRRPGQG